MDGLRCRLFLFCGKRKLKTTTQLFFGKRWGKTWQISNKKAGLNVKFSHWFHFKGVRFEFLSVGHSSILNSFLILSWPGQNAASDKPRTFHKYLKIVYLLYKSNSWRYGWESFCDIEGRTVDIKNLRTGLWAGCPTILPMNSIGLLAETKRRVRLTTNVSQVFLNSYSLHSRRFQKLMRRERNWEKVRKIRSRGSGWGERRKYKLIW